MRLFTRPQHRQSLARRINSPRVSAFSPRAFTLIEILVVVVIIGITGAIIVPQIGSRDDIKAAAAARVLMADLIYAQNLAITNQKTHYVRFDVAARNYTLQNSTFVTLTHPIDKDAYVVNFGSTRGFTEMTLESASFVGQSSGSTFASIGFDELGSPVAYSGSGSPEAMASGQVVLKCGQHRLRIDIEPCTGQITVTPL